MKVPLLTTVHPPLQPMINSFILINLLTSITIITSDSPSTVSNLFSDYYSKGVTDTMLTIDTSLLEDLVSRYDEYLSEEMAVASRSTWYQLRGRFTDSFADNGRLRVALKSPKQRNLIAQNLADLLTEVRLFSYDDIFNEIHEKSKHTIKATTELITFNEEDGFKEEVMSVLFGKTVKLRKGVRNKDSPKSVDIVQKVTLPSLHFIVPLSEVIDEIVWLCLLRNCVNRAKIFKPGLLTRIVSTQNTYTEELYIGLYVARVKALLYVAFLGPRMSSYYRKKTMGEAVKESKTGRCIKGGKW